MRIRSPFVAAALALTLPACPADDADDDPMETGSSETEDGETGSESGGGSESSTGDAGACAGLEIAGSWNEMFPDGGMQTHTISDASWTQASEFGTSLYNIESCDNATGTIIAQGDSSNEFNPDLYSKFEWTAGDGDAVFYCQSVFDAATAQDAMNAAPADRGDPAAGGCGMFPWSSISPG